MARSQEGDRDAWAQIVSRYAPQVLRYLRARLGNSWDAEDVAQEVFVKVLLNLASVKGNFSAWIWAIARNELSSFLRKRPKYHDCVVEQQEEAEDSSLTDHAEWRELLEKCLMQLKSELREVVRMRLLDGTRLRDIANRQGIAVSTAHARCEQALVSLRDCIGMNEN